MATTAIAGYGGSVTGSAGTEIKKWSATIKVTMLDATSMASAGWEEFVAGLQGCSGSFDCIGTAPAKTTTAATLTLKGNASRLTISGNAMIESVAYNVPVEGLLGYTATFRYTGAVTVS